MPEATGELPPEPGLRCLHAVDEPVVGRAARAGAVHTDNRLDETNGATYTTPPLTQDFRLSGPLFADLWVTTTAQTRSSASAQRCRPRRDLTDLTAGWLAGIVPGGRPDASRYVNGQLMQPWHPFTKDSALAVTPGEPMELPIEMFPTTP